MGCLSVREAFDTRIGYSSLCSLVESITEPTIDILQQGLNMVGTCTSANGIHDLIAPPPQVVDGQYHEGTHSIHNTSAVAMLVRWLKSLPGELRTWLVTRLHDLCSIGAHNKQRCCSGGVIRVIIEVLASSQGDCFSLQVEGSFSLVVYSNWTTFSLYKAG